MKSILARSGLLIALIVSLAGCGKSSDAPVVGTSGSATAKSPMASFSLIVDAGLTPVTVPGSGVASGPVEIKFKVIDSSGLHVPGLKLSGGDAACGGSNVRFAIAKFDGDNWQNLIQTGNAPVFDSIVGATLDENAAGYYNYRSANSITAVKDGVTVHRAGLRLCFVDPANGATVKVNPYIDFTLGTDGIGIPVRDSQNRITARQVVDKASCNECHKRLAARHDDGLIDPNICVLCHNTGSIAFTAGNPIDFKLMIHKFHMGKKLTRDYRLGTFVARQSLGGVVTGVDYPQEQRNCVKCHDGSATAVNWTPNGENWKTKPSKNACLACHDNYTVAGSKWQLAHASVPLVYPGFSVVNPDSNPDSLCVNCHGETWPKIETAAKHAVPEWTMGASYQYNIHAVTWNPDRTVSVEFSVNNPANGSVYDIKSPAYQYTTVNGAGTTTKNFTFGNLAMLVGWGSGDYTNAGAVAASTWGTSCTTAVPSGTPTCNVATGLPASSAGGALVTRGQPVAVSMFDAVPVAGTSNHFMLTSTVLPATATGTGVVALQGSVSVQKDANTSYTIPVKNAVSYFAIGDSGAAVPRRTVVSADKCNACHGRNINMNRHVTSHGGSQTEIEVCVICHNGNNVLNGTTVVSGAVTVQPDSAHFKRLIHMKHKAQGANYPVMPSVVKTTGPMAGSYTGISNCDVCHVNGSYLNDAGVTGSSTLLEANLVSSGVPVTSNNATITDTVPSNNPVISPKASACSSCHIDDKATDATIRAAGDTVKKHMINVGGAAFGTLTQGDIADGKVNELCYGCHAPGAFAGVDVKHGLK